MDPPFDYDDFYFIDDPPKFLQVLRVALTAEIETSKDFQLFESELSQIMNWHVIAEWGPIHYKKEVWELINRSPENLSNILLAYFTKPEHYHKENEYRFLLAYVAEVKNGLQFLASANTACKLVDLTRPDPKGTTAIEYLRKEGIISSD